MNVTSLIAFCLALSPLCAHVFPRSPSLLTYKGLHCGLQGGYSASSAKVSTILNNPLPIVSRDKHTENFSGATAGVVLSYLTKIRNRVYVGPQVEALYQPKKHRFSMGSNYNSEFFTIKAAYTGVLSLLAGIECMHGVPYVKLGAAMARFNLHNHRHADSGFGGPFYGKSIAKTTTAFHAGVGYMSALSARFTASFEYGMSMWSQKIAFVETVSQAKIKTLKINPEHAMVLRLSYRIV